MKHKAVSAAIAAASLAAVAAVAWWGFHQRTSPGPLHPTHAAVKELRGNRGCDACHGEARQGTAMRTGMTASCLSCHEPIARQRDTAVGIHAALAPHLRDACEQCHREHLGANISLVSDNSFQLAGIALVDQYDHSGTPGGLKLSGKHATLECQNCHKSSYESMLGKGEFRYLGLSQECASCHDDVHKGELGNDCASCHGQERPFKESPLFKHPGTFPLKNAHSAATCSACHTEKGVFTGLATDCLSCHRAQYDTTTKPSHTGTGLSTDCASCHADAAWDKDVVFTHPAAFPLSGGHDQLSCNTCHTAVRLTKLSSECAACHQDDYDGTKEPSHATAGMSTSCADCHSVKSWRDETTFKHPTTFQLVGSHSSVTCAECHAPGQAQQNVTAFRAQQSCATCHPSPHKPEMVQEAARLAGTVPLDTCITCHHATDTAWNSATTRVTESLHAATGFPLIAPHLQIDCAKCHTGYDPARTTRLGRELWTSAYPGRTPQQCEACHVDVHDGQFLGSTSKGRCATCHEPTHFTPTRFGLDEHAHTAFPLEGSHTAVACAACHKAEKSGSGDSIRRFTPTTTLCADCHDDVHKGAFDSPSAPRTVRGTQGCARCHTTADFRAVSWNADDHKQWTGAALLGKHATARCDDCHRRGPASSPRAKSAFTKAPERCVECHTDPHAAQFVVRGVNDCARCHQSTDSFANIAFDHTRDSRFALDADHAALACDACHRAYDTPSRPIVRYKPLGTLCADCHGVVPKSKTGGQGP